MDRVYRAVAAKESADEVHRVIREVRRADRVAAVNYKVEDTNALQLAHRSDRGDLVGLLLENGADPSTLFKYVVANPLVLCIHYDLPKTLRKLIRAGRDAKVLVREGGAEAHPTTGDWYNSPLGYVLKMHSSYHDQREAALDALVALGVNLADAGGFRLVFMAAETGDFELLRLMLSRGLTANWYYLNTNLTPLMAACGSWDSSLNMIMELLRLSSPETRRRVTTTRHWGGSGKSAVDFFLEGAALPLSPQQEDTLTALLMGGVPVGRAENRPLVMRVMAERADRQEAIARGCDPTSWRGNEAFVNLAFDFKDLRAAEARVEERERRVAELEAELRRRGIGTQETEEEEEEDDDDDDKMEEGAEVGGGAGAGSAGSE